MNSFLCKFKKKPGKKNRGADHEDNNAEKPEVHGEKPEEPKPSCSTQEHQPGSKSNGNCLAPKVDSKNVPRSNNSGGQKNGTSRTEEGKVNEEASKEEEILDSQEACNDHCSETESSRNSLGSTELVSRTSDTDQEETSENSACENKSLDDNPSGLTDDKPSNYTETNTSEANNDSNIEDTKNRCQTKQVQLTNLIKNSSNTQQQSSSKHQIPAEVEGNREAENQLFPLPVQEQAIQKAEPLASEILSHKETMDTISILLDQRSPVLSNWENLACLIRAPQDILAQCKRATSHSPTELLFESFKSLKQTENLLVIELIQILKELQRNDAVEVIENHIPSHEREKRLVSEAITDKEEILEDLATKLDKRSKVLKNWKHLGLKLKVKKEILQEIENGNSPNAVQSLFEYIYPTMPDLTVEKFREIMVKIQRMDVKDLLTGVQTGKMREVIPLHSDLMCSICFMLNKKCTALKNWRHLASELGIDYNTYRSFEPDPPESPTSVLLDWKLSDNPDYKVRELCTALKEMKRFDAIEILEKEFGQNFRSPPQS